MPIANKTFAFNVGEISNRVLLQLCNYKELEQLTSRIHSDGALTRNQQVNEIIRLWYMYTLDHMLGLVIRGSAGEAGTPDPVVRFAHRRTRPEMDDLFPIIKIPDRYWQHDPTMELQFRNRDLILRYTNER